MVSRESVTVSTEWAECRTSDSKDAIEKLAESGALLTREGWVTDNEGFASYCNTCGRSNGTHSYHCNNDR